MGRAEGRAQAAIVTSAAKAGIEKNAPIAALEALRHPKSQEFEVAGIPPIYCWDLTQTLKGRSSTVVSTIAGIVWLTPLPALALTRTTALRRAT
jgi:hypothetical protein